MIEATEIIPEQNLSALRAEVERLARRARRLGLPEPQLRCGALVERVFSVRTDGKTIRRRDDGGKAAAKDAARVREQRTRGAVWRRVVIPFIEVTVSGTRPQLPGGWELQGVVEWLDTEDGPEALLRMVPGVEAPAGLHEARNRCDHCKVSRRRNTVILVKNEAGELRQIGSSCIEDYLPGVSLAELLAGAESIALVERLGDFASLGKGGGEGREQVLVEDYLAWVVRSVRKRGWISRSRARAGVLPTADDASADMFNFYNPEIRHENRPDPPTREDHAMAEAILSAVREMADTTAPEERSDFIHNLCVACRANSVTHRTQGLVAAAVVWYERETQSRIERERRAARADGYLGQLKKRDVFTLRLTRKREIEGDYGTSVLHVFEDLEGRDAVWFASYSASRAANMEPGKVYKIKGTPKTHERRNGRCQTKLVRCAVVEAIGDDASQNDAS